MNSVSTVSGISQSALGLTPASEHMDSNKTAICLFINLRMHLVRTSVQMSKLKLKLENLISSLVRATGEVASVEVAILGTCSSAESLCPVFN